MDDQEPGLGCLKDVITLTILVIYISSGAAIYWQGGLVKALLVTPFFILFVLILATLFGVLPIVGQVLWGNYATGAIFWFLTICGIDPSLSVNTPELLQSLLGIQVKGPIALLGYWAGLLWSIYVSLAFIITAIKALSKK
jgi:hypothetical protein